MTPDHVPVVLLPGAVLPAAPAYEGLLAVLGDEVQAVAKDLEIYAGDAPPPDYSIDTEIDGIARAADAAGFEHFNLVGYSGGGASSLAFAARHPDRLLSLALLEPAWAGNDGLSKEELALREKFDRLEDLPPGERMRAFTRLQLAPGVEPPPPPPGDPPPWMAKRPAGIAAIIRAFNEHELDLDVLRRFDAPVYYALGGLSNPDYYERQADRLALVFPNFTCEVFDERHHFDPAHRLEPERLARSLERLWSGTL